MLVLDAGHGLPGYAEVWTRSGWTRLDMFTRGDVLACDPETGATSWEAATVHNAPSSAMSVVRSARNRLVGVADAQWPVRTNVVALYQTTQLAGRSGALVRAFEAPDDAGVALDDNAIRLIIAVARRSAGASHTPDGALLANPERAALAHVEHLAYAAYAATRREAGGLRVLFDGGLGVDRLYGLSREQASIAFDEAFCGGMCAAGGAIAYETDLDDAAGFVEWLAAAHGYFTSAESAGGVTTVLGHADDQLVGYTSDTETPADGMSWWLQHPLGFHVVRMGGVFIAGGVQ